MDRVCLFTLDEDLIGDGMMHCTDELFASKVSATIFVDHKTSMSRGYIAKLKEQGFDLQMHWVRFPRRRRRFPLLKSEPFFADQKEQLESLLDKQVTGNRTHGLEWKAPVPRRMDDDFTYPWRIMAENGVQFSSSTFGFPEPFWPVNRERDPFGLIEIPVTHFEVTPRNPGALVVGLYHPHYKLWREAFRRLRSFGYIFKTMSEYVEELKR